MHRILVLTSTFPRWVGDTEPRFVFDLCRHLSGQAEIMVVAPHTSGAARRETMDGVVVQRFRYLPGNWQGLAYEGGLMARMRERPWRVFQLPFFLASSYLSTVRALLDFEPDVIHAHWLLPQGLIGCLASSGRCPVLCTSHGGDTFGLQARPLKWLKAWILRRCRAVTVVSEGMVAPIRRLSPETVPEVVPMGTDLKTLFTPPADHSARSEGEILFAGRLVRGKGVDCLLDALALLRKDRRNVSLKIVGDGPLRDQLVSQALRLGLANDTQFLGTVSHRHLADLFRSAAMAVFPFDGEQGFGLVITEAMGCGCPVIASDLPASRGLIRDGATGLLTPCRDSHRLAEAIGRLLADSDMRKRLADAALVFVRDRFDWESVAARYMRIVERCLR